MTDSAILGICISKRGGLRVSDIRQLNQMSRYAKKPVTKHMPAQDANRRVQTEAADIDELDIQQAIQKFKNLQDKSKTPQKYGRNQSKSPMPHQPYNYASFTYTNQRIVGQGSFGVVYKSKVNETGEIVAIKKVIQDKRYKNREIQIMQELEHPNIIEAKHAYFKSSDQSDETYLHVIMEYYPETLSSVLGACLKQNLTMPELLTKVYSYQLLRGLGYLNSKGVCHRDIKPQNILINQESNVLKICDFGSAKKLSPNEPNISYICARCYRAPELLFGATEYSTQIDVWSAGCLIAEMLNGKPLFLGNTAVDQLVEIIKVLGSPTKEDVIQMNEHYDMKNFKIVPIRKKDWKKVFPVQADQLAVDLVSKLLVYSPKQRLSAFQALAHSYFDDLRDEGIFKLYSQRAQIPDLFDFTREELVKDSALLGKLVPKWYIKKK